jgi:hypothetical protein
MPVIPATWEAEIDSITVPKYPRQKKKFRRLHLNRKGWLDMVAHIYHSSYGRKNK